MLFKFKQLSCLSSMEQAWWLSLAGGDYPVASIFFHSGFVLERSSAHKSFLTRSSGVFPPKNKALFWIKQEEAESLRSGAAGEMLAILSHSKLSQSNL